MFTLVQFLMSSGRVFHNFITVTGPKKMFTIRGCSPKRDEICGDPDMFMHTCMCLKYALHIIKLISQISLTFGLFDKS